MALNAGQLSSLAQYASLQLFVANNQTATFNVTDLIAAATAIDAAFDFTLTAATAAVGGGTTIINGLAAAIPAPFNTASGAQKTMLACWVLMKRAGIL